MERSRTGPDGVGPGPLEAQPAARLHGRVGGGSMHSVSLVKSNVTLRVAFKGNAQCNKPTVR